MKIIIVHFLTICLLSTLTTAMSFKDKMDKMEMLDKMEKMEMMDKEDKIHMPVPEPRCKKQGQFMKNPNGDQCSYLICVYGGESYDAADHKPLLYTRPMPCAPGTYVPTDYKDTRPARNPCVGMDTEACPAPEKPTTMPPEEEQESDGQDDFNDNIKQEIPYGSVQTQSDTRRADMERLYEEMKMMMEQMMAIRRRLQAYGGTPGNFSPEPRTFEASPGLFEPEPTMKETALPVEPKPEPEKFSPAVRLQQAGFALAGGNGIVTSLPKEEVNKIWHGVQKALKQPDHSSQNVAQSQGYPDVEKYNQEVEAPPPIVPQMGYRPILTKPDQSNPSNPRVVYLLPVRMPLKRKN